MRNAKHRRAPKINGEKMKIFKIIILGLIVAAVGAGFYFRNDILKFYKGFGKQAQSFQRTDLGQMILQIQKIFRPQVL